MKKETLTQQSKFPFKLKAEDAKKIVSQFYTEWKDKLVNKWGAEILMQGYAEVSKDFYEEIINACTSTQREILYNIFGTEEETFSRGQIFYDKDSKETLILAQITDNEMCFINLFSGNRWKNPITIKNHFKVTEEEISRMGVNPKQLVR